MTIKIKMLLIKFLFFITTLFICCYSYGCVGVLSKYNQSVLDGEKICVYANIENEMQRVFIKTLKDNPFITELEKCNYLLVATIYSSLSSLSRSGGVKMEENINANVIYNLYKYDAKEYLKVKDILNNPTIREFHQYTSGKNVSMSKGSGASMREARETTFELQGILKVYNDTNNRLARILKLANKGTERSAMSYFFNILTPTASVQNKSDIETQLARELASRIIDDVIFDIIDFKAEEHKGKCRQYYDAFIEVDLSKYVLLNDNVFAEQKNSKMTEIQKKDFELSCKNEFKEYIEEKQTKKDEEKKEHIDRLDREKQLRKNLELAGKRAEIEEYILQENRRKNNEIDKIKKDEKEFIENQKLNLTENAKVSKNDKNI